MAGAGVEPSTGPQDESEGEMTTAFKVEPLYTVLLDIEAGAVLVKAIRRILTDLISTSGMPDLLQFV